MGGRCTPLAGAAPAKRVSGAGLSKRHSSPLETPHLSIWEGAGLIKVRAEDERPFDWYGAEEREADQAAAELDTMSEDGGEPSKRGKVLGFSAKSQMNLRRHLARIEDRVFASSMLMCLTYPAEFPEPESSSVYKRHLDTFAKALSRKGWSGFWVLEFQKRGAPHFHLVVFAPGENISDVRKWVSRRWFEIVGSGDSKHLQAGTNVEYPRNAQKARGYVAKYCSKGTQTQDETWVGRYWGEFNRAGIPYTPETVIELTPAQARAARRVFRAGIGHRVWLSAWGRLQSRAAVHAKKHFGVDLSSLTSAEFRKVCDDLRRGSVPSVHRGGETVQFPRVAVHASIALACGGTIRWPKRWRARNNQTAYWMADASNVRQALERHPAWNPAEAPRLTPSQLRRMELEEPFPEVSKRSFSVSRSYVLDPAKRFQRDPF